MSMILDDNAGLLGAATLVSQDGVVNRRDAIDLS